MFLGTTPTAPFQKREKKRIRKGLSQEAIQANRECSKQRNRPGRKEHLKVQASWNIAGAEAARGRPTDLEGPWEPPKEGKLYPRANGNHGEFGSGEWHQTCVKGRYLGGEGMELKGPRPEAGGM